MGELGRVGVVSQGCKLGSSRLEALTNPNIKSPEPKLFAFTKLPSLHHNVRPRLPDARHISNPPIAPLIQQNHTRKRIISPLLVHRFQQSNNTKPHHPPRPALPPPYTPQANNARPTLDKSRNIQCAFRRRLATPNAAKPSLRAIAPPCRNRGLRELLAPVHGSAAGRFRLVSSYAY